MKVFEFSLVLHGITEEHEEQLAQIFKGGCIDASITIDADATWVDFSRTASSAVAAMKTALRDVRKAGFTVNRVEPGDLVTEPEIVKRLGVSREHVRLSIAGKRGPGHFPQPVSGNGKNAIYCWSDVVDWAVAGKMFRKVLSTEMTELASAVRAMNTFTLKNIPLNNCKTEPESAQFASR